MKLKTQGLRRELKATDQAYAIHTRNDAALAEAAKSSKGMGFGNFSRLPTPAQYEKAHLAQKFYGTKQTNKMLTSDTTSDMHKVFRDVSRLTGEQHSPGTTETLRGMLRADGSKFTDFLPKPIEIANKIGGKVAGKYIGSDPSTVVGRDSEFKNAVLKLMQQGGGEVPLSPLAARTARNIFANPAQPKVPPAQLGVGGIVGGMVAPTQTSLWINKLAGHPDPREQR